MPAVSIAQVVTIVERTLERREERNIFIDIASTGGRRQEGTEGFCEVLLSNREQLVGDSSGLAPGKYAVT